jgi:hypothetical protein
VVAPRKPVIIKLHPDRRDYVRAENDFLRAIGLCVNTWAFVDRELYRIFRAALRSLHPASTSKEASALYYKKRTLGQHIKMVDDKLALVLQPDQLQSEWRPLQRRIKDATQTRNIVAHHPALRTGTARAGKAIYRYSIYIEPFEQILNQPYPGDLLPLNAPVFG